MTPIEPRAEGGSNDAIRPVECSDQAGRMLQSGQSLTDDAVQPAMSRIPDRTPGISGPDNLSLIA
jgi:hypothetical protein